MKKFFTATAAIILSLCVITIMGGCIVLNKPEVVESISPKIPVVSATPSPAPVQSKEPEEKTISISWEFVTDMDNDYQLPYLDIYLIEDSEAPRKTLVYSTIGGIYETTDRSAWNIPDEAENVFYTFYAGAGVHFYTKLEEGNILSIMYRFVDEMDIELRTFETLISIDYEDDAIVTVANPIDFIE